VHARKAWLNGLNPKKNRTIPPLHYDYVYQIKQALSVIPVVINGNINQWGDVSQHLKKVDGVMLGRLACQNPYAIAMIHHDLFPDQPLIQRSDVINNYSDYALSQHEQNIPINLLLKPIFNVAHGLPGARRWKSQLMSISQSKEGGALSRLGYLMKEMEQGIVLVK
jgi:tRNA-dihydrouridine synthase A